MAEYEDYPKDELVEAAESIRAENLAQGVVADVYFKATCPECGARPMFSVPNTTFATMECCDCGHVFPFTQGNYMVVARMPK